MRRPFVWNELDRLPYSIVLQVYGYVLPNEMLPISLRGNLKLPLLLAYPFTLNRFKDDI
jgi:hypothetical protein